MRIYLDNNIFVSIEDNEISVDVLKNIDKDYSYFYSYVHIQELIEASSNFDELQNKRLKTILDLTSNLYLYPDNNQIISKIESPEKVITTVKKFVGLMNLTRQAINNFRIDRAKLIRLLNIDEKRMNNYTPDDVIKYLDTAIRSQLFIGLDNLIDLSGFSLHERIFTLFNLLDFLGFWKDKKTLRSNLARMYDSSHTYFASFCDLFVSDDHRARNKAKVAYKFYKIDTKVLSLSEFMKYDV